MKIRPRVLFYSHDGLGLGHFRRTVAVAEGLGRRLPKASMLLLTGLPVTGDFALPQRLDYVRMPGLEKRSLFQANRAKEPEAPDDVFALRKAIIAAASGSFAPHLVVVDHTPAGLAGELLPLLNGAGNGRAGPKFALGLRDIIYGPERTRREWERTGSIALLESRYDAIFICGSPLVFDPIREYGLSAAVAAKTRFTGYFRRPKAGRSIAEIRRELGASDVPLVVVTVGSGADGAGVIDAFLGAMRGGLLPECVAAVVAGPRMAEKDFDRLQGLAEPQRNVSLFRFRNDLESLLAAADVVVTMGGYNSVWEAIGAGKRPIVVPRQGGSDEQPLRAERVSALGLATTIAPEALSAVSLAGAITWELTQPVSPPALLDFDGLDRTGEALAEMLER